MASSNANHNIPHMMVIPTVSTEEAGAALGVGPASVRQRIKDGTLSAVRVNRGWRIHLTSLNALLSGVGSPAATAVPVRALGSQAPLAKSSDASTAAFPSPQVNHGTSSPQGEQTIHVPAVAPKPSQPAPLFSHADQAWINRYRCDLTSSDPEVRRQAKWHLDRFAARAEHDSTRRVLAKMSVEECQAAAAEISTSLGGRSSWW